MDSIGSLKAMLTLDSTNYEAGFKRAANAMRAFAGNAQAFAKTQASLFEAGPGSKSGQMRGVLGGLGLDNAGGRMSNQMAVAMRNVDRESRAMDKMKEKVDENTQGLYGIGKANPNPPPLRSTINGFNDPERWQATLRTIYRATVAVRTFEVAAQTAEAVVWGARGDSGKTLEALSAIPVLGHLFKAASAIGHAYADPTELENEKMERIRRTIPNTTWIADYERKQHSDFLSQERIKNLDSEQSVLLHPEGKSRDLAAVDAEKNKLQDDLPSIYSEEGFRVIENAHLKKMDIEKKYAYAEHMSVMQVEGNTAVMRLQMQHKNDEARIQQINNAAAQAAEAATHAGQTELAHSILENRNAQLRAARQEDLDSRTLSDRQLTSEILQSKLRMGTKGQRLAAEVEQIRESFDERIKIAKESGHDMEAGQLGTLKQAAQIAAVGGAFRDIVSQQSSPAIDSRVFGGIPVSGKQQREDALEKQSVQLQQTMAQKLTDILSAIQNGTILQVVP